MGQSFNKIADAVEGEIEKLLQERDKYKSFIRDIVNMKIPKISTGENPGMVQLRLIYNAAVKVLQKQSIYIETEKERQDELNHDRIEADD